jgi:hypothetical protein
MPSAERLICRAASTALDTVNGALAVSHRIFAREGWLRGSDMAARPFTSHNVIRKEES